MITGFGPEIDPHELGHRLEAFVLLELTQGRLAEAVAALEAVPEVLETDAVSGPQDLICRVAARDTEHLQEIVNRLLATDAIRHTTSYVVLSRPIRPRCSRLSTPSAQACRCSRSPCGPKIAISSTGPSTAPNQCGVQVRELDRLARLDREVVVAEHQPQAAARARRASRGPRAPAACRAAACAAAR